MIKLRGQRDLTIADQRKISKEMEDGGLTAAELSAKHKVKLTVINRMKADRKRGEPRLKKRVAKQMRKVDQERSVTQTVSEHLDAHQNIYTVAQVQKLTLERTSC